LRRPAEALTHSGAGFGEICKDRSASANARHFVMLIVYGDPVLSRKGVR
jgi:hypothetical protein